MVTTTLLCRASCLAIFLTALYAAEVRAFGAFHHVYQSPFVSSRNVAQQLQRHQPSLNPLSGHTKATESRTSTTLYDTKIPPELKDEIYQAEANTEAGRGRKSRVTAYGAVAIVGLLLGLANTALTEMSMSGGDVESLGYGWTQYIPLLSTKWGGFLDIIVAGGCGTMVELEMRTRDETAERIWEEMQTRKEAAEKKAAATSAAKSKKSRPVSTSKGGKKKSRGRKKRMAALAEVVEAISTSKDGDTAVEEDVSPTTEGRKEKESEGDNTDGGILGAAKRFYKQADDMAAAQALLLNKELEERGVVEKITDETGLKVIGKEAAAKEKKEGKE